MPNNIFQCCIKCKNRHVKNINGKLVSCHYDCQLYKESLKEKEKQDALEYEYKQRKKLDDDSYAKYPGLKKTKKNYFWKKGSV